MKDDKWNQNKIKDIIEEKVMSIKERLDHLSLTYKPTLSIQNYYRS